LNNEGLLNASPFEIGAVNPGWWRDNDNEEGRVLKQRTPGAVGTRRRRSDYFLVKPIEKTPWATACRPCHRAHGRPRTISPLAAVRILPGRAGCRGEAGIAMRGSNVSSGFVSIRSNPVAHKEVPAFDRLRAL